MSKKGIPPMNRNLPVGIHAKDRGISCINKTCIFSFLGNTTSDILLIGVKFKVEVTWKMFCLGEESEIDEKLLLAAE